MGMNLANSTPTIADERDTENFLCEFFESSMKVLESITLGQAIDLYLDDNSRECQKATVR